MLTHLWAAQGARLDSRGALKKNVAGFKTRHRSVDSDTVPGVKLTPASSMSIFPCNKLPFD